MFAIIFFIHNNNIRKLGYIGKKYNNNIDKKWMMINKCYEHWHGKLGDKNNCVWFLCCYSICIYMVEWERILRNGHVCLERTAQDAVHKENHEEQQTTICWTSDTNEKIVGIFWYIANGGRGSGFQDKKEKVHDWLTKAQVRQLGVELVKTHVSSSLAVPKKSAAAKFGNKLGNMQHQANNNN